MSRRIAQAADPHAGIDKHVTIAATYMPDIAAEQRHHMRLPQQRYVIVNSADLKPAVGNGGGQNTAPVAWGCWLSTGLSRRRRRSGVSRNQQISKLRADASAGGWAGIDALIAGAVDPNLGKVSYAPHCQGFRGHLLPQM